MNLATIPAHVPFLDTLARRWLAQHADPARGLILLPTRRAARALAEAFLRTASGRPMLLPRITAFGALDEVPLALAGSLDLPPAIETADRLALLARLILALNGAGGAPRTADRAWPLAAELARLMDEAELAGVDLAARLPDAADAAFATHWDQTLRFLDIVTRLWPRVLAERGQVNPAARQVALLHAQARAWQDAPPADPVWAAGSTGAIDAVASLLRTVARLPQGCVVLPGLDAGLDDAAWEALDDSHPQAGLKRLLAGLGATRADVERWEALTAVPASRIALLSRALLPAAALDAWRDAAPPHDAGLTLLHPADQQEEAVAIALILRDAIETPGAHAALVTPDRGLASRVAAELLRFGVVADDSAGEALGETPPAVFVRLLAEAIQAALAPVPLLALCKHPLFAAGMAPQAARAAARALEHAALRGPRPAAWTEGLPERVADAGARELVRRLRAALMPLETLAHGQPAAPETLLATLVRAAEALAASDTEAGTERLWRGEDGAALSAHLAGLLAAIRALPDQPASALPGLLAASLSDLRIRTRRALRGRDGAEHPRIFIWGLLEARLQAVDTIVLGSLAEGVWPPAADPGPWLSRPMRARIGLPAPEQAVGQAAHDFVGAACAAPRAVLSSPRRRDGAPAVPARWLARLEASGAALPEHPAAAWARVLDLPLDGPTPCAPPRPCPPILARPRKLSVTEIGTWWTDPYAIYARRVLRLEALPDLDEAADAADYGTIVHAALHGFLARHGATLPENAAAILADLMDAALAEAGVRPALAAWWRPRLRRIADWMAGFEIGRRADGAPLAIAAERSGQLRLDGPAGPFLLTGRADRLERWPDGTIGIIDYKTGSPPGENTVRDGSAPQLPLEAAMAALGGFGADFAGPPAELSYWRLPGGRVAGEAKPLAKSGRAELAALADEALARLRLLVATYDDPAQPYLAQPFGVAPRFSDYAQLARAGEWGGA